MPDLYFRETVYERTIYFSRGVPRIVRQNFTAREMSAVENKENIQEPPNKKLCKMPVESVMMQFAKLSKNAFSPTRGSKLAAGYDLYRYSTLLNCVVLEKLLVN